MHRFQEQERQKVREEGHLNREVKRLRGTNKRLLWSTCWLSVTVIAIISLIMVIMVLKTVDTTDSEHHDKNRLELYSKHSVCRRPVCEKMAAYFKDSMDDTADPCDDFYKFACGGFVKKQTRNITQTIIQDNVNKMISGAYRSKKTSRSRAVRFVMRFREKCVEDTKNQAKEIGALKKFITDMGGMPLVDAKTYNKKIPWWKRQAILFREYSYIAKSRFVLGVLIEMRVDSDGVTLANPGNYLMDLFPFNSSEDFNTLRSKMFFSNMSCILNNRDPCSSNDGSVAELREVMEFEQKLNTFMDNTKAETKSNVTIRDLEAITPKMPWFDFLKEVFVNSSVIVDKNSMIFDKVDVGYFKKLPSFIDGAKPNVVANYFGLQLIQKFFPHALRIDTAFKISGRNINKKALCDNMISSYFFPEVVSRLFVMNANLSIDEFQIREMATNIQKSFLELIENAFWLDETTKAILLSKIAHVEMKMGYPKWVGNNAMLDQLFNVPGNPDDNLLMDLLHGLIRFATINKFQEVVFPMHEMFKWYMQPFVDNALNMQNDNYILIPGAKYLPSAYWRGGTKAVNYGAIGRTIAHEIGHCVDRSGVTFDSYGNKINLTEMWGKDSLAEFNRRVDCIIDQYSKVYDKEENITLNGTATTNDDVSDNAGLRAAYNAYMASGPEDERLPGLEDLDDQKLFFLSTANYFCSTLNKNQMMNQIRGRHSPHKFRAYLPPANFDKFSEVFNCPFGSNMNKKDKCIVW